MGEVGLCGVGFFVTQKRSRHSHLRMGEKGSDTVSGHFCHRHARRARWLSKDGGSLWWVSFVTDSTRRGSRQLASGGGLGTIVSSKFMLIIGI
jgi:hypothetical protein